MNKEEAMNENTANSRQAKEEEKGEADGLWKTVFTLFCTDKYFNTNKNSLHGRVPTRWFVIASCRVTVSNVHNFLSVGRIKILSRLTTLYHGHSLITVYLRNKNIYIPFPERCIRVSECKCNLNLTLMSLAQNSLTFQVTHRNFWVKTTMQIRPCLMHTACSNRVPRSWRSRCNLGSRQLVCMKNSYLKKK